jgi:hypothetical protein
MGELDDQEFIAKLEELKRNDIDAFMELVLFSLKTHEEFAVEDDAPIEHKREALKKIMNHFEGKEEYEDCAFIRDLQKRIDDAEKRQVSRNE